MAVEVELYVKQLSQESLTAFITKQNGVAITARIKIRLTIRPDVYEELVECLESPCLTVTVEKGEIVSVKKNEDVNVVGLDDFIISLLEDNRVLTKKELYEKVTVKYPMSVKTLQNTLRDLSRANPSVKTNYNNCWLETDDNG
jgi:hypothetical protein